MRLIVAGQVPTAPADRELFFQDVSLLLQALLGLAVGEDQVRVYVTPVPIVGCCRRLASYI